ncbi:TonB-dependent receptor plug domain-containing protein [Arcicella lustrica]|uniref:TonB-dependent receptor n=1 Tax=Arcicella lustrica TaxID=2984196 RepID=A0ABU5SM35_9BACT|nr:TonB-dependent receptor [Arcicella sp. DC25W]MEA5428366.1 TonB-dependent receptor [Arcicella sp. DC25W]
MSIFTCLVLSLSIATDSTIKKQNFLLDEVTVITQRNEQKVFNTMGSVAVLNAKNLKNYQYRSTPETLFGANGVFVQKTNHGGGSPFLRGLTGNQTLILIDGIRLNNSTFRYGPNQYLNTIDPFLIQNIEIYKGGGSVQYGSDALGGTLQINTANPVFAVDKPKVNGNAIVRYGTSSLEKTARTELSFATQKMALKAGLSLRKFGDLIGGDTTGVQTPSGYDELAFDVKAKFQLSKNVFLTATHQNLNQSHVPVYHKVKLENFKINEMSPQKRALSYLQFDIKSESPLLKNLAFNVSYQGTEEGRNSQKNGSNVYRVENDQVKTFGSFINVRSEISPNWDASSGIEFYTDKVNSTKQDTDFQNNKITYSRGLYPDASSFNSYAAYSLHHINLNKWDVNFGARFNAYSINVNDQTLGKVNVSPQALVGNLALGYHQENHSMTYLSFNTGFRAPNIDDMGTLGIVDFRYELPTANLKPENSYNFEWGYKFRTPTFSSSVALYHNQLRNLIARVKVEGQKINDYQVYRKENVEKAYIQGFEWATEWMVLPEIKIYTDLAYTYGQNETKNEPVRRIPPLSGRAGVHYQASNAFFVKVEDIFAGKQDRLAQGDKDDNRIPKGGTNGWNVLNIYSGYEYKNVTLIGSFQNIFNVDYRTHGSGINGVGRSLIATLMYRF